MRILITKNTRPIKKRVRESILLNYLSSVPEDSSSLSRSPIEFVNEPIDPIEFAKSGGHIIAVGFIGLTCFSAVCDIVYGIDQREQTKYLKKVLDQKETGTLYPVAKMTVLPYRYDTTTYGNVRDISDGFGFTNEEIENHISDAIIAERDFIKAKKVLFLYEDLGFNAIRYITSSINLLCESFNQLDADCYFTSINNKEFISRDEYLQYPIEATEGGIRSAPIREIEMIKEKELQKKIKAEKKKEKLKKRVIDSEKRKKVESSQKYKRELCELDDVAFVENIVNSKNHIFYYHDLLFERLRKPYFKIPKDVAKALLEKFDIVRNKKSKYYKQKEAIQSLVER